MNAWRTSALLAAAIAVAAVAMGSLQVSGSMGASDDPENGQDKATWTACGVPSQDEVPPNATPLAAGHYPHEQWIANDQAQQAVDRIDQALTAKFGLAAADRQLREGLIGVALDHASQRYTVVVDPALPAKDELQDRLTAAARGGANQELPFAVAVVAGCRPASTLTAALATIRDRSWHTDANKASYGFYVDASTSTVTITFGPDGRDAGQALAATLGDAVTIRYAEPTRLGRLNDGQPHWGGAGVGSPSNNNHCTSGFTVVVPSGNWGSVSAGHCFNNNQNIWSGSQYYGGGKGKSNYPQFDMIRIAPFGQSFTNRLHVDPCCPSVRTVIDNHNPSYGSYVCASGMVTRAKCGLYVASTNSTFCGSDGCTPNLFIARRIGDVVAQRGDSGAPVYIRSGSTGAIIRGMVVAQSHPQNIYAHKVGSVMNHLSVSVVK